MPLATRTTTTVNTTWNRTNIRTRLNTALVTNLGFTSVFSNTGVEPWRDVYSLVLNGSASKGTVWLEVNYDSSHRVLSWIGDGLNGSNVVLNPSSPRNITLSMPNSSTATDAVIETINHPELKLAKIYQGVADVTPNFIAVGIYRPTNKPVGWDENSHLYCFSFNRGTPTLTVPGLNPYGITTDTSLTSSLTNNSFIYGLGQGGYRDILTPVISTINWVSPFNYGCTPILTSSDLASVGGADQAGAGHGVSYNDGTNTWLLTLGKGHSLGIKI